MYKSRNLRKVLRPSEIEKNELYSTSGCRYYKITENCIVQCDITMTENYKSISKLQKYLYVGGGSRRTDNPLMSLNSSLYGDGLADLQVHEEHYRSKK